MWLVQRDRTILAVNEVSAAQGTMAGRKCFSYNPDPSDVEDGACKGCQAGKALSSRTAIFCDCKLGGKRTRGYWIPLKGTDDVYLHGYTPLGSDLPVVEA
jgi:hypothetical protein